jgi:16S rRNA (cytosine1402-N4)-methyltransferase
MRMDSRKSLTAAEIVNSYDEEQLSNLFYLYGELNQSRKIAKAIVTKRAENSIATTSELAEIIRRFAPRNLENKVLAQAFQAIRIEVNDELGSLKEMLSQCAEVIKPGGRLVVMSYHSLEDRLVKNFIKTGNFEGVPEKDFYGNLIAPFDQVNRKIILASDEEIERNPRARSAKLRIAEGGANERRKPKEISTRGTEGKG